MTDSSFREALLKQNGARSIEAELAVLNGLLLAEEGRARRLKTWTITVWVLWLAMVVALFVGFPMAARKAPGPANPAAGAQPVGWPPVAVAPVPAPPRSQSPALAFALLTAILIMMVGAVGLPIVGVVLLIVLLLDRRSASMSQVRTSLASIEEQLTLLALSSNPAPGRHD